VLIPKGLDEKEGEQVIAIARDDRLSGFAAQWVEAAQATGRFILMGGEWNEKRTVPMTTLDRLIATYGVPRFIKIDVEGYELNVLKGLTQPIATISFEYATPELAAQCIACIKRISDLSQDKILCNYSVGETLTWALPQWVSSEEMLTQIRATPVFGGGDGDIYIRYQPD
jgi:hypothetical protein